ncbi:hypothetical protein ACFVVQ_12300 [Paenibacillus chitinolyticus]|uniref:hypothetical protein n=1 Tax=Paenibacillus chitinolyticus TaxID=79263 RepID=UPI0036DE026A
MAKTVQHEGKEYVVVADHGPEEVTAFRHLGNNNIEIFSSFAGIPRISEFNIGEVKKVLEWIQFSSKVEHLEWNWRHNREIEQGAAG